MGEANDLTPRPNPANGIFVSGETLGIVALDFGEGLWCFRDEIGRVTRRSR